MKFNINARRIVGASALTCNRCAHQVVLPDDAMFVMYDDGTKIFVINARDRSIVHHCGNPMYWVCPECGHQVEALPRSKREGWSKECRECHIGILVQRQGA